MSTAQKKANASNADMRPFPYTVRVVGYEPIIFQEHAPAFLCSANPPVNEGKAFLSKLVMKHQQEVMASKPWGCSGCNRSAISMVHTPMMYLHLPEPFVVDFAQPVCQNGGDCENRARQMINEVTSAWK